MIRFWKERYCENGYQKCARFVRSNGGRPVPITLLPNGKELKSSLVKRAGRG